MVAAQLALSCNMDCLKKQFEDLLASQAKKPLKPSMLALQYYSMHACMLFTESLENFCHACGINDTIQDTDSAWVSIANCICYK